MTDSSSPLPASARRRRFVQAIVVGLASGLLAVAFRYTLEQADSGRTALIQFVGDGLTGALVTIAFALVMITLAVLVVQSFAPEAAGSGIPHVEGVLHRHLPFRWLRVMVVKFIGGVLAIGGGLTLGREGPTVQLGAAVGAGLGRVRCTPEERRSLIAFGAGAGLAATFNAPLAGMAFVFEELRGSFRPGDYLAALLACVMSDYLARWAFGQGPIFGTLPILEPSLTFLPLALLLGVIGGAFGVLLNAGILRSMLAVGRMRSRWRFVLPFAVVIGLCEWQWTGQMGDSLLGRAFHNPPLPMIALAIVGAQALLTVGSYSCGAAGGLFSPILITGAYLGVTCGGLAHDHDHALLAVILGMAGLLTGSVRAPVTSILLMLEMTGSYAIILPLLVAVLAAEFVAGELGGTPIYSELLRRNPLYSVAQEPPATAQG